MNTSVNDDSKPASGKRKRVLMLMFIVVGLTAGTLLFTFVYAEGASYISNDSKVCANCHIMQQHYDSWLKSSHHAVAQCNDCHSDPASVYTKLKGKAINGFLHSYAFTTGDFHEPIQMTNWNREQMEKACRDCHSEMVHQIDLPSLAQAGEALMCTQCHRNVGHPWR